MFQFGIILNPGVLVLCALQSILIVALMKQLFRKFSHYILNSKVYISYFYSVAKFTLICIHIYQIIWELWKLWERKKTNLK